MAYTKLFNSIVTSTIWTEDDKTRIVWVTMLALADKNGEVQGSVPGLARVAGVPVDATREAIAKFLAPDLDSRTKDDEGKRIEEIDGGWALLNHDKYRAMASKDERKDAAAERQRRKRDKDKRNNPVTPVTPCHALSQVVTQKRDIAEAEAEAEAEADAEAELSNEPPLPPRGQKEWNPDPIQIRLNALYRRRPSNPWDAKMLKTYRAISFDDEEIALVEKFHADPEAYKRKSLSTLLNTWDEEVDRARMHRPAKNQPVARTASRNQPVSMFPNPHK